MDWFNALLTALKSETGALGLAGLFGAVATSLVEWNGWVQLFRQMVVGSISAIYLSELSVPLLEFFLSGLSVGSERAPELGGFIMGMLGMVIIETLVRVFKKGSRIGDDKKTSSQSDNFPPTGPTEI